MSASPLSGCAHHGGGRAGSSLSRPRPIRLSEPVRGEECGDLVAVHRPAQRPTHGTPPHRSVGTTSVQVAASTGKALTPIDDHRFAHLVPDQPDQLGFACALPAADARADGSHGSEV